MLGATNRKPRHCPWVSTCFGELKIRFVGDDLMPLIFLVLGLKTCVFPGSFGKNLCFCFPGFAVNTFVFRRFLATKDAYAKASQAQAAIAVLGRAKDAQLKPNATMYNSVSRSEWGRRGEEVGKVMLAIGFRLSPLKPMVFGLFFWNVWGNKVGKNIFWSTVCCQLLFPSLLEKDNFDEHVSFCERFQTTNYK